MTYNSGNSPSTPDAWPDLPFEAWKETCATLHMMCQVAGKIRMELTPHINHWWNVPLYVTVRGLSTCLIPYGNTAFELEFDFTHHDFLIRPYGGEEIGVPLRNRSVAAFYREVMEILHSRNIAVEINTLPCEIPEPVPFEKDTIRSTYEPEYVQRFHRALLRIDRVFNEFRARFIGKASPAHFFWGSFDHAVTRFSGRTAPAHPGSRNVALSVMREAYSHEVSSAGFWPGAGLGEPAFYSYSYPEPPGFREYRISPRQARYDPDFGEFLLPYDAVRNSGDPDGFLLEFLQSTYEAAAVSGGWDRRTLEVPSSSES